MGFYLKIGLYRIPPYSVFGLGEFHPIIEMMFHTRFQY
jgi:hypothetical protein